jgi:hypothetical protein
METLAETPGQSPTTAFVTDRDKPMTCPYCKTVVCQDSAAINGIRPEAGTGAFDRPGCEFCNPSDEEADDCVVVIMNQS